MIKLKASLPRILPLLLSFALALTAIFASATIDAGEEGCCGDDDCNLDYPYIACDDDDGCENEYFPVCCDTDGFCSSGGP